MTCSMKPEPDPLQRRPPRLTVEQIEQIDEMLETLGEYGEIHLIVQRGELRYINKVESHTARKDHNQR